MYVPRSLLLSLLVLAPLASCTALNQPVGTLLGHIYFGSSGSSELF